MIQYGLIGAAGYIAPRHLKAMKETNGNLSAAFDINDSVGIMDQHFPDAAFFTEFEQYQSYVHEQRLAGNAIDYFGICSPNYLHKAHMSFALRAGADAICEKPLVLYPDDIDDLQRLENETGKRINTILQLRLHPAIVNLQKKISEDPEDKTYEIDLGYFTSRGAWYHQSWKGFEAKSGGIATNIGVHFYDMLFFLFGPVTENIVHHRSLDSAAGYLEFKRARVRWMLSINRDHLPEHTPENQTTHRSITIDGEEIEFSGGFTDLHTASYQQVLLGNGFGLDTVRTSIEVVDHIRDAPIQFDQGEHHPNISKVMS